MRCRACGGSGGPGEGMTALGTGWCSPLLNIPWSLRPSWSRVHSTKKLKLWRITAKNLPRTCWVACVGLFCPRSIGNNLPSIYGSVVLYPAQSIRWATRRSCPSISGTPRSPSYFPVQTYRNLQISSKSRHYINEPSCCADSWSCTRYTRCVDTPPRTHIPSSCHWLRWAWRKCGYRTFSCLLATGCVYIFARYTSSSSF